LRPLILSHQGAHAPRSPELRCPMRRQPGRSASLSWGPTAFAVSAIVLAGLVGLLAWKPAKEIDQTPLVVFCAAGLKAPVEEAAREYEKEYGVPINLTYGGSETQLAN